MAQTYTLEEAAGRLSLSAEEFKRRLKDDWKQIRSFRDGATLRFRAADIDELARVMGEASDPGLQLGPVGSESHADESGDFLLSVEPPGSSPRSGIMRPGQNVSDKVSKAPAPSTKVGKPKPNLKPPSDSDISVEPSDRSKADSEHSLPTEEISLDLSGPGSAIIRPSSLSGKHPASKPSGKVPPSKPAPSKSGGPSSGKPSGPAARIPGPASGNYDSTASEFELSLDADSDSFELQLGDDSSESEIGGLELAPPGGEHGGLSGINLGKPADSGLSLEAGPGRGTPLGAPQSSKILPKSAAKSGPKAPGKSGPVGKTPGKSGATAKPPGEDSDVDFELALEGPSSAGGPKSQKMSFNKESMDSEFELTLDDSGPTEFNVGEAPKTSAGYSNAGNEDILATDFELPAVEGDSDETQAFDENSSSDFDLAISDADVEVDQDESASQVVLVDDSPLIDEEGSEVLVEEGDALSDPEIEQDEPASASRALRDVERDEDEDFAQVRTVAAPPAQWGSLPAAVLLPSFLLLFIGGLMSFELVRGMWGYHQPGKPSSMLLRGMADTFGIKVSD